MSLADVAQPVSSQQFPVVGVGASAGGLEAFKLFIQSIPKNSAMAYVFVQHLSSGLESQLAEILQKHTQMPVHLITNYIHLQPDHIYVIPPDQMLTVVDGSLKLEPIADRRIKIIDLFFSSLGVVHQSFAVGVVLSGSLNDGTLGLQVIKANGGLTFAQDESSAAFDSMPKSAVKAGAVDFILPPEQIVPRLIAINRPFKGGPIGEALPVPSSPDQQDEEVFKELLTLLRVRKGVNFTDYKQSTVKRRIARRMALSKIGEPKDYLHFIRENKSEQDALYQDMLISVTHFFRDTKSFDSLCKIIFPGILKQKAAREPLRIWVAGCATGEEAYSMAICLHEFLGDKAGGQKIQIFATDISETAINKARSGIYNEAELEGISIQRKQQFFIKMDGHYQVKKSIRELCIFAHHNILGDPPFSKVALISCRNVLIYLEPVLQKRALSAFHYALNENGYLMLGKSETTGSSNELFTPFNKQDRIYQPKGPHGRYPNIIPERRKPALEGQGQTLPIDKFLIKDIHKTADSILLSKYSPSGVLVNQNFDIIEFRRKTDPWLSVPMGKPSLNVLKMAREGLSFEIRSLLQQAKTQQVSVRKEGIFFKLNGIQQYVDIEVVPLADASEAYYLILFQNSVPSQNRDVRSGPKDTPEQVSESTKPLLMRIEQLENELAQAREDMRAVTEMQDAANEELQSANEELLSGSEELQSLNEELEASKEELQSTNEEIITVNNELLDRNEQLDNSRKYTEKIFSIIHDSLVVLNKELIVLRATDGFYKLFKTREQETEGQFLYKLDAGHWNTPALRHYFENILPEQGYFEGLEVGMESSRTGPMELLVNAQQFDTHTGEKLIMIAVSDITTKKKLAKTEKLLQESRDRLSFAIESAGMGTWDLTPSTGELIWDKRSKELFGYTSAGSAHYNIFLGQVHPDDRSNLHEIIQKTLRGENGGNFNAQYRMVRPPDQKICWMKSKGKAYFDEQNQPVRFVGTVLDISTEKQAEQNMGKLLQEKDEFMSIASHELKTPITSIKAGLQILERSMTGKEEFKNILLLAKRANQQTGKLADLVKDLLDVTKIQSGSLVLDKFRFPIVGFVRECCEQISDKSGDYEIIIHGSEDLMVYADRNRTEQVMTNLITNAIKYAPGSNIMKIAITKEIGSVKITVTDFGIGVAKEKIPFLFDRFFRAEEVTKNYAGLGLGLYISAEIVKRHHGEIGVESEPGKGSSFWFTLPDE
ncbi:CheR family methyltransferase [Mucilaginibacter arboris]|uniref:PAS domain-containing protein n=1 Tax=Mucilaginibacter arboris TaxID=2682090 RepID=A0A7K1SWC3_9SPHI|nr:CheR family methyltransferase [Mucilaginibacter arboris]MVN21616.1 PAS domain-containing protein [Mucilaginibacter arboris]